MGMMGMTGMGMMGWSVHICLCTTLMPGALRGQTRISDALEVELQIAVCLHVHAGGPRRAASVHNLSAGYPYSPDNNHFFNKIGLFCFLDF